MSADLDTCAAALKDASLRDLAKARAGKSVVSAAGWTVDLSRHYLDSAAEAALLSHGTEAGLETAGARLFGGEIVNPSENRPALHWALRAQAPLEGEAETAERGAEAPKAGRRRMRRREELLRERREARERLEREAMRSLEEGEAGPPGPPPPPAGDESREAGEGQAPRGGEEQ